MPENKLYQAKKEQEAEHEYSVLLQQKDGPWTMRISLKANNPDNLKIIEKCQRDLDAMPKERQPIQWSPEALAELERTGFLPSGSNSSGTSTQSKAETGSESATTKIRQKRS